MNPEASNEGIDHNLDLNLGISPPFGNVTKQNEGHLQFHSGLYGGQGGRSSRMENSMPAALVDPPFKGLARTSDPPFFWNGLYPGLFPSEERAMEKRIELGSPQGLPNWA